MASTPLSNEALDTIFRNARSYSNWLPKPVDEQILRDLYDLMKMGPTSANTCPARIIFVKSDAAKNKLLTAMNEGNIEKTRTAPVTAIIAQDMAFYEKLPKLFPHTDAKSWFVGNDDLIQKTAFRNSSLQGAYFMIAARSLGLDCGPMSGFDNTKVDELFLKGTTWKSNFVVSLGYGDASKLHPRSPRLDFDEAAEIV